MHYLKDDESEMIKEEQTHSSQGHLNQEVGEAEVIYKGWMDLVNCAYQSQTPLVDSTTSYFNKPFHDELHLQEPKR